MTIQYVCISEWFICKYQLYQYYASSHNYFDDSDLKKQLLNHQQSLHELMNTNLHCTYHWPHLCYA